VDALRKPVKYIVQLFEDLRWSPVYSTAAPLAANIYYFSISDYPDDSYWLDWGGEYDNVIDSQIIIYFGGFLSEVSTLQELQDTQNSFYFDSINLIYINVPVAPWLYDNIYSTVYGSLNSTFASSAKNVNNPSDQKYGNTYAETRLKIPSITNQIGDVISGIVQYNQFSVSLDNSDGYFDGFDVTRFFNSPIVIRKTTTDAQTIPDHDVIRRGIVNDISPGFGEITISASDNIYQFIRPVCRSLLVIDYPDAPESSLNKPIPIGWGTLLGINPIEVDRDTADPPEWIDYLAIDPLYIVSVEDVDKDGQSLAFTFTPETGIIRVTELDDSGRVIEAGTMSVTGRSPNTIGDIIKDIVTDIESVDYNSVLWDTTETDYYISISPEIGLYINGGTTRDVIASALASDNAYLIQKNNGQLTIRRWGESYNTQTIASWLITQNPEKSFSQAFNYFMSSARVLYKHRWESGRYSAAYLDETMEAELSLEWKRSYLAEFKTDILIEADAQDLAERLLARFGTPKERTGTT